MLLLNALNEAILEKRQVEFFRDVKDDAFFV